VGAGQTLSAPTFLPSRLAAIYRAIVAVNPNFPHPTTFLGYYSGRVASPSGRVVALWTDMRLNTCFGSRCGWAADAFFAAHP
jgi:hypothetical protein